MITLNDNYSYKYTNSKNIYCISRTRTHHLTKVVYYTIPHTKKGVIATPNAILGFTELRPCIRCVEHLRHIHEDDRIVPFQVSLEDVKYMGAIMNLPLVVVIGDVRKKDSDGTYEIYYHYKNRTELDMRSNCG